MNPKKGALKDVFGQLVAVQESPQVGKQWLLVTIDEIGESPIVAAIAKPVKEFFVGRVGGMPKG